MQVIPGDVIIEPAENRSAQKSQPIEALGGLDPQLDDATVREAIAKAEASNQDPRTITMQDFAQGPQKTQVPEKFLTTDGVVDVEKIQASTRQLDEEIAKRDPAPPAPPAKTVEDYLREYQEKEKMFRSGTVPKAPPPPPPPPAAAFAEGQMSPQQMEELVRRDYAADPLGTTTRLLDLMLQKKFQPLEERQRIEDTRSNIARLAEKDPRILTPEIFTAINAKIANDPDIASRKNPHKAAWLEVKEEMRLGEPSQAQALPSRLSPILGGGSPPSTPSSSVQTPVSAANLNTLDLRDKKQEAAGDAALRAMLQGNRG